MSHVLNFRSWYRLNEDNKEIVVFNEVKKDEAKGWKAARNKPYSKLTDNDFLFRLFYFTNPDSEIVYKINSLLGEDTGDIRVDWENSPEHIKQEIIGIIKSYILTLS